MKVIDMPAEAEALYHCCLQEWSDELKEQGDRRERWYRKMKDKGLRVKFAVGDNGIVGGMIHYVPIECSNAEGKDLYFVNCIWVHGHKEGRGDFRGRGMGTALLSAAEQDVRALGRKGLVTWGVSVPAFMRAKWFKKHGYKAVDKDGVAVLMWKPFADDATPPRWIRKKKEPVTVPGKVSVTVFSNGWCPAMNIVAERARRASAEFGDKVLFSEFDTTDRDTFLAYGISDALFVDSKAVRTGPPPSYEKVKKRIAKRVRKLKAV